jgi:type I restriction-modification system DNA methylase subunit
VSAGIGFRTSRDLEFFREELVRKNWLDAVVALPAGAMGGTRVEGLLLMLKQDRKVEAPIQMVAAQELLTPSKERSAGQGWDPTGVKELAQLLNDRRDGSNARLITAEELEVNGFSFQVSATSTQKTT